MKNWLIFILGAIFCSVSAQAGGFIFAGESNGVNVIAHPTGYTGSGGVANVSVCVDPASTHAAAMEIPVQNIVIVMNELQAVSPNLISGGANNIPSGFVDFESVALHEVGHCIGLAHPNLGSQSGVTNTNSTNTTNGVNNVFNENDGADNIFGSADDIRGDDANLHWFRETDNNPFLLGSTVDISTYSRDLGDLPGGDLFAANADRTVASLYGFSGTEAVMQQGSFFDEDQRRLAADDEAMLRLGMAGVDRIQGTGDDYTINLTYAGLTTSCDIVLRFNNAATGFANCSVGGSGIATNHIRITSATSNYNTGFDWFFNDELLVVGEIFTDGFESGDTTAWAEAVP